MKKIVSPNRHDQDGGREQEGRQHHDSTLGIVAALHKAEHPERRQQEEGIHIALKDVRRAPEQRAETKKDETTHRHVQQEQPPIGLAPMPGAVLYGLPHREVSLPQSSRKEHRQDYDKREQKSQRAIKRQRETNGPALPPIRHWWRNSCVVKRYKIFIPCNKPIGELCHHHRDRGRSCEHSPVQKSLAYCGLQ